MIFSPKDRLFSILLLLSHSKTPLHVVMYISLTTSHYLTAIISQKDTMSPCSLLQEQNNYFPLAMTNKIYIQVCGILSKCNIWSVSLILCQNVNLSFFSSMNDSLYFPIFPWSWFHHQIALRQSSEYTSILR